MGSNSPYPHSANQGIMRDLNLQVLGLLLIYFTTMVSCVNPNIIPPALRSEVNTKLTFIQLQESPDSYVGQLVLLGGVVLSAIRSEDATEIEVLQLPLNDSQDPGLDRETSQGRFLAFQKESLDPTTLPDDSRITLVGELVGTKKLPHDEVDSALLIFEIKTLKKWPCRLNSDDWFCIYFHYYYTRFPSPGGSSF